MEFKNLDLANPIIVDIRTLKREKIISLIDELQGVVGAFCLHTSLEPLGTLIQRIKKARCKVILDSRLCDIPSFVQERALYFAERKVDAFTILSSDRTIMEAAIKGRDQAKTESPPLILAIPYLSHLGEGEEEIEKKVLQRVKRAVDSGLDGVITSAWEMPSITKLYPQLYRVAVAIRPPCLPVPDDDQKRISTPSQAIEAGAHAFLIGRPITQSNDPKAAVVSILEELSSSRRGKNSQGLLFRGE